MTTNETVGQRLTKLRKHYRLTQDALAQTIGLSRSYVSVVSRDLEPMTAGFQRALKETFTKLNINWLLYGEGEMLLDKEPAARERELNEAGAEYRTIQGDDPLSELRRVLDDYGRRIRSLEDEMAEMRKRKK